MPRKNPAYKIGYTRNGAVVKRFDGVHFVVQCACGAEFKCGWDKLRVKSPPMLHCNQCRHKRLVEAGTRARLIQTGQVAPPMSEKP